MTITTRRCVVEVMRGSHGDAKLGRSEFYLSLERVPESGERFSCGERVRAAPEGDGSPLEVAPSGSYVPLPLCRRAQVNAAP